MLNRMKLENFKAWREADLTFGRPWHRARLRGAGGHGEPGDLRK